MGVFSPEGSSQPSFGGRTFLGNPAEPKTATNTANNTAHRGATTMADYLFL
jgi:hypothetical protein